jgi:DNA-binding CsgD family transcriptional regulator
MDAAEAAATDGQAKRALDTIDGITTLVEHSLLRQTGGTEHEPRYLMLETVREFAMEELFAHGAEPASRRRHAEWCCLLAEEAERHVHGPNQIAWLNQLDVEFGNLSAAMAWAAVAEPDLALQLGGALNTFWHVRGHVGFAQDTLTRALEAGGSAGPRAKATLALTWLAYVRSDLAAVIPLASEARRMFRSVGDATGEMEALHALGLAERGLGEVVPEQAAEHAARAEAAFREELALAQEHGSALWVAYAQVGLGGVNADRGDLEAAADYYTATLDVLQQMADHRAGAWVRVDLGRNAVRSGDFVSAARWFSEALALFRDLGDQWSAAFVLGDVAELAIDLGKPADAARLIGAADGLRAVAGGAPPLSLAEQRQRVLDAVNAAVGDDMAGVIAVGERLGLEGAVAEALALLAPAQGAADAIDAAGAIAASLTAREREVLRLLVEGLSDREVAAALGISPRTVGGHVANLLDKFNVSSRGAAAVAAVRLGIVPDHPDSR